MQTKYCQFHNNKFVLNAQSKRDRFVYVTQLLMPCLVLLLFLSFQCSSFLIINQIKHHVI